MIPCATILRRVTGPIGGAWIPYTAAQVAARRAAQMVAVVVCAAAPGTALAPAPLPVAPPMWPAVDLVPLVQPIPDRVDVSAPGSLAVLAVGLLGLWRARV